MELADDRNHLFFFFNDTATTEIYTLSLHDALPILAFRAQTRLDGLGRGHAGGELFEVEAVAARSEEHTSELQSQSNLVCRLLLEKKKKKTTTHGIVLQNLPCACQT